MVISGEAWFKNWPEKVPKCIKYPNISLCEILEISAKNYPEKDAIVYGEQKITYKQLNYLSKKFAKYLINLGIKKSDCVAIYLPNTPQFIVAYFGALKIGAVVTTISPMHREREVQHQLYDSGATTIITSATLYPIVQNIKDSTSLEHSITSGLGDFNFVNLLDTLSETDFKVEINPKEDLAAIQYTGGTTGTSKGAMLTHRNLVSNAYAFASMIQATSDDVFLTVLPLSHIYGMTTSLTVPISLAATIVLLPKFRPIEVLAAIQNNQVTVFCGVPTMYQMLLSSPNLTMYKLNSIRVCISGASPLPPQVQKQFMKITQGILAEGYGLSEASPVTHCTPVDKSFPLRVGSIGLPLPNTQAKIVDLQTGEILINPGEIGELTVKGPQVMKGYWKKPKETALVLRNGWLLTGDIAFMDSEGYFYITDRKKDLIKHKDYSVYPRELEDLFYEHPAVKLCAVIGKPHPIVGEVPKAFVVLKEGFSPPKEELQNFINNKVASYKAIREIEFRKELPLSSAGKILKQKLRAEATNKLKIN